MGLSRNDREICCKRSARMSNLNRARGVTVDELRHGTSTPAVRLENRRLVKEVDHAQCATQRSPWERGARGIALNRASFIKVVYGIV
jgi:hypothetical protein